MDCNNELELAEIEDLVSENQSEMARSSRRLGLHVTARTKRKAAGKLNASMRSSASVANGDDSSELSVKNSEVDEEEKKAIPDGEVSCFLPGTQRIFARTWGCTHNTSDTEFMLGLLAQAGYLITENAAEAHLWLLNSCTVKDPAEAHFRNEVLEARRLGKYVVVAGCVPQATPTLGFLSGLSAIGVQQIDRIVEVVEETLRGNSVRLFSYKRTKNEHEDSDGRKQQTRRKAGGASLAMPKIRRNALIEIIPISTGCLNQCTYCKTRHARGELGSYEPEEIIARAKQALSEGVREVWLTSEDTGAYGKDIGTTLTDLLDRLVPQLPEDAMLRVGMTNPPYVLAQIDGLVRTLQHPQVYSFIHIPVQSGSDRVLADMKREYTVSQFRQLCDALKAGVPHVTIATDLICAFPTETKEDFGETLELVKQYQFPVLFVNQFYARSGTPAARMQRQCSAPEAKQRTRDVHDEFMRYNPFANRVGTVYRVVVTDESFDGRYLVGHNKAYEQILLSKEQAYLGGWFDVEVTESSKFSMKGEVIRTYPLQRPLPTGSAYHAQGNGVPVPGAMSKVAGGEDNYAESDWQVTASGTTAIDADLCNSDCSCGDSTNGFCCSEVAKPHGASEKCCSDGKCMSVEPAKFSLTSGIFNRSFSYLRGWLAVCRLPTAGEVQITAENTWFVLLASAVSVRIFLALKYRR